MIEMTKEQKNELVASKLGKKFHGYWDQNYCENIGAAFEIVGFMESQGYHLLLCKSTMGRGWCASFWAPMTEEAFCTSNDPIDVIQHPAMAITIAFLKLP